MKKKGKILSLLLVVLLVVLVVAANVWRRQSQVGEVRVEIDYARGDTLVTAQEVAALVGAELPSLASQRLRDVDLKAVEKAAAKSPFLYGCQAGSTVGGSVVVYARQRRPIVRVCVQNEEYYLDSEGCRVPMSATGSCDVIVASGHIPAGGQGQQDVLTLARFFDQHPEVAPLFDQIYREASGNLYVTPKLGSHVVEVGSAERLEEKFHNLLAFYTRGLPQAGWETYGKVSIKYRGQVVCTKRNNN